MTEKRFSEQLTGKDGPDLVHKLMLAEVKILQEMENYTEKRAALDYEYGEKLAKLHERIKIGESDPHTEGSQVEKAWRTYLTESENKAITIMNNAKNLSGSTQQNIKNLRARKKDTADKFYQQKLKIEAEYLRSQGETDRLQVSYQVASKEAGKLKEKLDEIYKKNKSQKDWQKGKERFDDASRKLHMNHNLYFLSIKLLNIHQNHKVCELTTHMFDVVQEVETKYIKVWKDIFLEMVNNSSWSRPEFISSEKELRQTIDLVSPATEFKHFIAVHKKDKKPLIPHLFDVKLIEDSNATSGLTDDLAVNDLTHDQLVNKKMDLEQESTQYLDDLVKKKSQLEEENKNLKKMTIQENNNTQYSTIQQYSLCQQKLMEIKETECKFACTKVQFDSIEDALSRQSNPKQPYIDLSPPYSKSKSNTSLNVTPTGSTERTAAPERKGRSSTLPRSLNKLRRNSFKSPPKVPAKPRSQSVSSETDGDYEDPDASKSLAQCDYFHGRVDRGTVLRLLKCDGDFIVREKSDNSGDNVLSVLWRGQTKHFILKKDESSYKLEGESFPTIPQLIDYHHQSGTIVQATTGVLLVNPIRTAFKPGDGYMWKQSDVRLDQNLGSGHFGEVFRGYLIPRSMPVAIKTCKPKDDVANQKQKFVEEAEIMKPCQHPNLVKLIGVCIDRDPYYILLELCEKGDLLNFLRKESVRLNPHQRIKMANDVAHGMAFLEQQKIIHRDLAARNCLVKLDMTVKICDFGMSREEEEGLYTMKETKVIPFKWTAPEVWRYNRYTHKSDVWSFGVTLWEIFSGGKQPYPDKKNHEAKRYVEEGNRLAAPSGTPLAMDNLMLSCWLELEQDRPTFQDICHSLKDMKRTRR